MSHKLALAALLSLATLSLVACTSTSANDLRVRPISDILIGDIQIGELTPTSAAVRVETSVDVACSVVFGTDRRYGRQATDVDMGGGAHRVHAARLSGLQPDTEYHYRLQGSGPDGALYASDSLTFRTPKAAVSPQGTNLAGSAAGARVIDVSSVFGGSATWAATRAIDGDPATEWSSQGDGDRAFLEVQLARRSAVRALGVWTRTMGSTAQIKGFRVVVDGALVLGPFELPDAAGPHLFTVGDGVEGHVFRFEVVASTGGNTGLVEFAVYEK